MRGIITEKGYEGLQAYIEKLRFPCHNIIIYRTGTIG